ncbi:InlB B-repeat-containing protein [Bifidobacterium callitrichos]|nr:InlB B-repeat-containing protein [Bifidobacterium callitrichos]
MTGNTKVWRASLAGLASIAMIATMGLTALGASAVEAKTFTFDVDGTNLKFDTKAAVSGVVVAKDGKSAEVTDGGDGYLDKTDVVKAESALDKSYQGTYTITGWENASGTLVATDQANADKVSDTEVSARYARTSGGIYTVKFSGFYTVADVPVAKDDAKLASWQFPTDTNAKDGKLLRGFVAKNQTGEPSVDASTDLADVVNHGNDEVDLEAKTVDSVYVVFSSTDWSGKQWTLTPKDENGSDYTVEVEEGKTLASAGLKSLPTAYQKSTNDYGTEVSRQTNTFSAVSGKDAKAIALDTAITTNTIVKPNYGVSEGYTVTFNVEAADTADNKATTTTQVVKAGDKAVKPADPSKPSTDNVRYAFDGWYETGSDTAFDFSNALTKNVELTAKFKASAIRVQFDPNYGKEPVVSKWFSTDDYFEAPSYEREGYELEAWKYGKYTAPEGAKLTIDGEGLKYVVNNGETASQSTGRIVAGASYTAEWNKLGNADTLTQVEGYVNRGLKDSEAEKLYTLDSYAQYKKDFQNYLADKAEASKDGYTDKEYKELLSELKALQAKIVEVGDTELYRVYNPNNGDHYFTTSVKEQSALVKLGWKAEGAPYKVVSTDRAVHQFGEKVFSVYNPNTGEHLLTFEGEADSLAKVGWVKENAKFYTVQNGSSAVVRVYNPNTNGPAHLYTNASEAKGLAAKGWIIDNNGKAVFTLD